VNFLYRNLSTRQLVNLGVYVFLLFTLIIGWLQWSTINDMINLRQLVHLNHAVQFSLENFHSTLSDAESYQLRYIITHNDVNLGTYQKLKAESSDQFNALKAYTQDNALQQKYIEQIEPLLKQKYDVMDQTIALTQKGDYEGAVAVVKSDLGRISMEGIEQNVKTMEFIESQTLYQRQDIYHNNFKLNAVLSALMLVFSFAFIFALLYLMRQLEQLQSIVTLCALTEMIEYEGGTITIEEYVRRRHQALVTHGNAQVEAERLLGLLGKIKPKPTA
jgi:CHASE3 domain sensor protein